MGVGSFWDYVSYGFHAETSGVGSFLPKWAYLTAAKVPGGKNIKLIEDLGRAGYEGFKFYTADFFAEEAPPYVHRKMEEYGFVPEGPELMLVMLPTDTLGRWERHWLSFRNAALRLRDANRVTKRVYDELDAIAWAAVYALDIIYTIQDLKHAQTQEEGDELMQRLRNLLALQKEKSILIDQLRGRMV